MHYIKYGNPAPSTFQLVNETELTSLAVFLNMLRVFLCQRCIITNNGVIHKHACPLHPFTCFNVAGWYLKSAYWYVQIDPRRGRLRIRVHIRINQHTCICPAFDSMLPSWPRGCLGSWVSVNCSHTAVADPHKSSRNTIVPSIEWITQVCHPLHCLRVGTATSDKKSIIQYIRPQWYRDKKSQLVICKWSRQLSKQLWRACQRWL